MLKSVLRNRDVYADPDPTYFFFIPDPRSYIKQGCQIYPTVPFLASWGLEDKVVSFSIFIKSGIRNNHSGSKGWKSTGSAKNSKFSLSERSSQRIHKDSKFCKIRLELIFSKGGILNKNSYWIRIHTTFKNPTSGLHFKKAMTTMLRLHIVVIIAL
jgi:hypothetical protein